MLRRAETPGVPLITAKAFVGPNGWDSAGERFQDSSHDAVPDMHSG